MTKRHVHALPTDVIRELDKRAIEEGIPGLLLMENAGSGAAARIELLFQGVDCDGIWIVCGKGNNAGDGFVVGRHLRNRGLPCRIANLFEDTHFSEDSDAAINLRAARESGVPVDKVSNGTPRIMFRDLKYRKPMVVDALLGTGLSGSVRPPIDAWIDAINQLDVTVVSLDTPSGLHTDTGVPLGCAIRADLTLTFVAPKTGFFLGEGKAHTGIVETIDISIPRHLLDEAYASQNP